jgi:lipoprotein-releasing system permease protein
MNWPHDWPYEWQVGWRYTRAGRAGRRNGFISFISAISVVGIALGVAALIIVLSVMNGFQREVRDRMLSVIAHVEIHDAAGGALPDWRATADKARQLAGTGRIVGAAPFIAAQSLIGRGEEMRGVMVRGIVPKEEATVTALAAKLRDTTLATLQPGAWRIVLGVELARMLGVREGDTVTIVAPGGQVTPAGVLPRLKTFTVAGTFDAGHYEYDSALALIHLDDAARLYRLEGASGVQLKLGDVQDARRLGGELAQSMGSEVLVRDWTRTNRNWFDAVQIEKRLMAIILTLIVAVAAFNLVSTLVMTVTDKRADIAILRTLGASPPSVMGIFVVQGASAGIIGTLAGLVLGLVVAFNIDVIVPAIERALGVAFLPGSIYVISRMPSDPQWGDIVPIALVSLALAFLATLYPSWRASRVNPAEALRYE